MSDALINGLAGAGGGIIAQIITYPLQTVRFSFFFYFRFEIQSFLIKFILLFFALICR